mmetsp:Transcript_15123/g.44611  ORF Transcript_15123/g.44611 Transcript_15123/m.44611 type:complete len:84 (-) Transcript_15123:82-333(-)
MHTTNEFSCHPSLWGAASSRLARSYAQRFFSFIKQEVFSGEEPAVLPDRAASIQSILHRPSLAVQMSVGSDAEGSERTSDMRR